LLLLFFFFFQAEDGIRDRDVTGVQTCALPISLATVGVLLAVFGYAIGTVGAIVSTILLELASKV